MEKEDPWREGETTTRREGEKDTGWDRENCIDDGWWGRSAKTERSKTAEHIFLLMLESLASSSVCVDDVVQRH